MLDVHWYLNWAGDFKAGGDESPDKSARAWDKIHFRACHSPASTWDWCSKYGNDVPVVLGEWSLATNHDAPLDLSDATTARELRHMYAEQLAVYTFGKAWANQSDAPLVGHFFWTLRMGSGCRRALSSAPSAASKNASVVAMLMPPAASPPAASPPSPSCIGVRRSA